MSELDGVRLPIEGMTCGSCVGRIERSVKKIVGVESVRVSLRDESMIVRRDAALVSNAALAQAVADAGYRTDPHRAEPAAAARTGGFLARLFGR